MNAKEYLSAQLARFGIEDQDIDLILLDNGIDPGFVVSGKPETIVMKTAMFQALPSMMAGLVDITEGGYSRKWNTTALKLWLTSLASQIGVQDPFTEPPANITGKSIW
jgi:hypothetical protein